MIKFRSNTGEPAERTILLLFAWRILAGARWLKGSSIESMHQKATGESALGVDQLPRLSLSRFRL